MIEVAGLRKTYRVPVRAPGVLAAAASLVRRNYREVVAVDDVSFTVPEGQTIGFLGPNGAGKTTTLKVLSGLLHPTQGSVRVLGYTPGLRERGFLCAIALVMGQKNQLAWDLPAADSFELHRVIYDLDAIAFRQTLAELEVMLELGDLVNKPVRQLSLGERMRCELALALLHRPRVLFLDEPTIGLDVTLKASVRKFLREYGAQKGATILLTSHDMDDITALCSRVVVIDHGRVSYDGPITELASRIRPDRLLTLHFESDVDVVELAALGTIESRGELSVTLRIELGRVKEVVARAIATLPIRDLTIEHPPLEEVMADLFQRQRQAHGHALEVAKARDDAP